MTTDEESTSKNCNTNSEVAADNKGCTTPPAQLETEPKESPGPTPGPSICVEPQPTGDSTAFQNVCPFPQDPQPENGGTEKVTFSVMYNKNKHDLECPVKETVASLKKRIESLFGVPTTTQKLLYKGKVTDEMTLGEWGLKSGSKVIVMASKVEEIFNVQAPAGKPVASSSSAPSAPVKEPLSKQKPHAKIIERGVPPEAMPAFKTQSAELPLEPLRGMLTKSGGKVRLTFKLEVDQLWIGTKERTEKVNMNSIRNVISEPIEGHEEYHIMAIQLGPTEASRFWVYWVPAQYIKAIKNTVLGK